MKKRKRKYKLVRYGSKQKINDSPIKYNGTKLVVLSVLSLVMGAFLGAFMYGIYQKQGKEAQVDSHRVLVEVIDKEYHAAYRSSSKYILHVLAQNGVSDKVLLGGKWEYDEYEVGDKLWVYEYCGDFERYIDNLKENNVSFSVIFLGGIAEILVIAGLAGFLTYVINKISTYRLWRKYYK